MATFDPAFEYLMENEDATRSGAITDNPKTGEYSKFGISLKTCAALKMCDADEKSYIDDLTIDRARDFYRIYFWMPLHLENLSQSIATKLLDMSVNMGSTRAVKIAQAAANALGATLSPDGIIGWQTLAALNVCREHQLMLELTAESLQFYRRLVDSDPDKYGPDWEGWKARAERIPPAYVGVKA